MGLGAEGFGPLAAARRERSHLLSEQLPSFFRRDSTWYTFNVFTFVTEVNNGIT